MSFAALVASVLSQQIAVAPPAGPSGDAMLLETNVDYLLQEIGDFLLLQNFVVEAEDGTDVLTEAGEQITLDETNLLLQDDDDLLLEDGLTNLLLEV